LAADILLNRGHEGTGAERRARVDLRDLVQEATTKNLGQKYKNNEIIFLPQIFLSFVFLATHIFHLALNQLSPILRT
jgi:hypothetical protein